MNVDRPRKWTVATSKCLCWRPWESTSSMQRYDYALDAIDGCGRNSRHARACRDHAVCTWCWCSCWPWFTYCISVNVAMSIIARSKQVYRRRYESQRSSKPKLLLENQNNKIRRKTIFNMARNGHNINLPLCVCVCVCVCVCPLHFLAYRSDPPGN